jgi:RND family efflux transporter MFP subunit
VRHRQAKVHLARANRDAARLTLEHTQVRSPLAGRIGRRLLDPGNLVRADETVLAEIVSRDPVHVYFQVAERALLRLRQGKWPPRAVAVQLAGEKGYPHRGTVDYASNEVDPQTATLTVRAVLPNPKGLLSAGLFARVRVTTGKPYKALLVPEEAVLSDQGERFVYVVNAKGVVERRPVRLGTRHDGWRVVQRGLQAEDRVMVQGMQRVRPGMAVHPREVSLPGSEGPAGGPRLPKTVERLLKEKGPPLLSARSASLQGRRLVATDLDLVEPPAKPRAFHGRVLVYCEDSWEALELWAAT